MDVRPGAHVRLPRPPAPVTRDSLQTPLVTGFPWSALRPQRYRLADLAANVSKRSRRLVHLRFPVARVTPVLAGSASLRLGVCSRGCTRVPGGVVTSVRQGRTLTVGSQKTWGRPSLGVGGQQEPAGRTPGPAESPPPSRERPERPERPATSGVTTSRMTRRPAALLETGRPAPDGRGRAGLYIALRYRRMNGKCNI